MGNFEAAFSKRRWDASLYRPILNQLLCQKIRGWSDQIKWPNEKQFAACLTHDVDSVRLFSRRELVRTISQYVQSCRTGKERLKHLLSLSGLRHREQKVDLFTPWMEEERKHGFRSTFYFFPSRVSGRDPRDCTYQWDDPVTYRGKNATVQELVREIDHQGFEIGLHGSFSSATNYDFLREQKEDLEKVLGCEVYSIRQHNLRFDIRSTPLIHERAGFQSDSTVGFNRDVGFRSGIAYPYRPFDWDEKRSLGLLEIPLVLQDGALLRKDNLGLHLEKAFEVCRLLIDRVAETRGVITLLWHPNNMLDPAWFELYSKLLDEIDRRKGWGASAKQIYDWWIGQGLDGILERGLKQLSEGMDLSSYLSGTES